MELGDIVDLGDDDDTVFHRVVVNGGDGQRLAPPNLRLTGLEGSWQPIGDSEANEVMPNNSGFSSPVRSPTLLSNPQLNLGPSRSPRLKEKASKVGIVEGVLDDVAGDGGHGVLDCDVRESVEDGPIGEPMVGMAFSSMLELEAFYKSYAESKGFGVVRPQGAYRQNGERRATTWRCECFGSPDQKIDRKCKRKAQNTVEEELKDTEMCNPKRRNSKKCHCTAMVRATINEGREWVIRKVVLEHFGHSPKPSEAKLVKEYRMKHITPAIQRKFENDLNAGVTFAKSYSSMAIARGGYDNMYFTEGDARYVLHRYRKLKMVGGDCNALLTYFERMQLENSNFFWTHRLDEFGFIKDILWVDPRSKAAYEEFGDVVCFDTTYLTNQYSLPFANFVGVNHHGQSILFGCALISNEDSDTFEWVFTKWLACMKGKAPRGILTDQAAAMRKPLQDVMPDCRHRWCIWHIMHKLPYKLRSHKRYFDLRDDIRYVVYNSLSEGEFASGWNEMLEKYELVEDEWLLNLFEERHMWVPTFMSDFFWAGMRSTQRIESIHNFFDQFFNRNTLLCEFGEKYIAAVEKRLSQEKEADDKAPKYIRHLLTGYSVERFFRSIYTTAKFKVLQVECQRVTYCQIEEEKKVSDTMRMYLVQDRVWVLPRKKFHWVLLDRRTYYCVDFNVESREAFCECKMFETHGIICRHLIRIYDKLQIKDIPEKYILRRWRKDVVRRHTTISVAFHDLARTEAVKRHDRLSMATETLNDVGAESEMCTLLVLEGVGRLLEQVKCARAAELKQITSTSEGESCGPSHQTTTLQDDSEELQQQSTSPIMHSPCSQTTGSHNSRGFSVKDPPIAKKRGRPRDSRFKTCAETGWKCRKIASDNGTVDDGPTKGKPKGKGSGSKAKGSKKIGDGKGKTLEVEEDIVKEPHLEKPEGSQAPKRKVRKRKSVSFLLGQSEVGNVIGEDDDELMD